MANTLTLTINVIAKNAKEINSLIDRIEKLNDTTEKGKPRAEGFSGGLNAATIAAGAASLAIGLLAGQVGGYVKSAIDAAARTEGLRNGLRAVIPDADEFDETLARIDKQARLPGLQKNDLLRFTTSLTAAGLTSDQTESALTILGSRITGFGQTSAEAAQVVGQFTQSMNRGKIEGDELNRLFETLPGFKNIVVEMTGVTGGAQELNKAFAAQGKTVQEGLIPLLEAYDQSLGAIKHDAALTKADAFEGALEDLRNTIGQKLLPIYKDFLDHGTQIADGISALVTGATQLPQPLLDIKDAFAGFAEEVEPLIEPLKDLGNAVLPLLQTLWEQLVRVFIEFVIPTLQKIFVAIRPLYESLIKLATPIINLINVLLPPLVTLLKGIGGVIIDVVLTPLRALAGALGWVIDKVTDLINLIPGAKAELEKTATASDAAAAAADKQATAIDSATESIKTQKDEAGKAATENANYAEQAVAVAKKQTELKVAVAASNIELKNAKQALKDATTPEEIEAASERVKKAITSVKDAKVAEAQTFEDESKKQIAILKAEEAAQNAHEKAVETSTKNRARYAKELTRNEKDEAKDRELAIKNEVEALSQLVTSYTTTSETEFNTRVEAFRSYKNKRVALADEIIKNIEDSEMTEAQKASAIRETHKNLAKDLETEWGKITDVEKSELEKQKRQADEESKAKAAAIKAQNDEILNQTEAYLIKSEGVYKASFGQSEKEQQNAFDRLLVSLTTHHAAEIQSAENQGKDTVVLEQKQAAEIETLQEAHLKRLQKQNDDAAKEETKKQNEALKELKSLKKSFFEAVEGSTQEFHTNLTSEQKGFNLDWNAAAKEGLQVFKDSWQDILSDVVDLGLQYLEDMKEINKIQLEAEQQKKELFAEMSEEYFEIERQAVEKLRALAEERVEIYKDAKTAIQEALDDHETRLVEIEEGYNAKIIEINTDATEQLKEIGIESNRDRLDDSLNFHEELVAIEESANQKREDAAEEHTERLAEIAKERYAELTSASQDFVKDIIGSYEAMQEAVTENADKLIEIERDKSDAITEINIDEAKELKDIAQELADEIVDINEDEADKLEDIKKDLSDKIIDIDENEADKLEDIKKDLSDKIVDINEDEADKLEDIKKDLSDKIIDIDENEADKLEDIKKDLSDKIIDIDESLSDELIDIKQATAEEIADIDKELSDELLDIGEELVDEQKELADKVIEVEENKLKTIEEINKDHQERLEDIGKSSERKQEDVDIDLTREVADLTREAQEEIDDILSDDSITGEKQESEISEIRKELARDIAEEELEAARKIEDIKRDSQRDRDDSEATRVGKQAEADKKAQEDIQKLKKEGSQAIIEADKKAQEVKDDAADARVEARNEADKKAQEVKDDAADKRVEARNKADKKAQEVKDDAADKRVEARNEADKKAQEVKDDAADARVEARNKADKKAQEVKDDAADKRQTARDDAALKAQETKDDAADARQTARDDAADARQTARDDAADKRQTARDNASDAKTQVQDDADAPLDTLNTNLGASFVSLVTDLLGKEAKDLFGVGEFDFAEFFGIDLEAFTDPQSLITKITELLPTVLSQLRQGEALSGDDTLVQNVAGALSNIAANANTGGILGDAAQATSQEGIRYLEALDNIGQWEIAANEVILNTQSLIVQAGIERTDAEDTSLTQRDTETQTIAETQNQAQASITDEEIGIKQETRDALNQLIVDYTNQALTIDAQTRVAIQEAQKQAADSFWSSVIEIGGTVLGVAAGAAVSGLTGGVIPPNIAIGIGAQLGQAGGGLLAESVVGDEGEDELFHFSQTDMYAKKSGMRSAVATTTQLENAVDFSKHFGEGFAPTFADLFEDLFDNVFDASAFNVGDQQMPDISELVVNTDGVEIDISQRSIDQLANRIEETQQRQEPQPETESQRMEIVVEQKPPADNFLLAQEERTSQLVDVSNL